MITNDMITRRAMMNDKLKDKDGTQITCEKCKGSKFSGLKIYGRSKQITTTGAQLLNLKSEHIVARDGVTIKILDNGCLFIDGTPIKSYMGVYSEPLALSPGDYYFSSNDDGPGSIYGQITIEKEDGSSSYYCNKGFKVDGTEKSIRLSIQNGNNMEHIDNYVLHVMVSKGSDPLPWEPYTGGRPSPSPDYLQEVESVGMRWSTGANLLDAINATSMNSTFLIQQNGYSITAQGTYAENNPNAYKNVRIALDPAIVAGKKITASVEYAENNAGELPRGICDINYIKQSGEKTYYNNFGVNNPITITIPEDIVSINCCIHVIENREETVEYGTYTTTVKGLMISIGDKVLPWEPYTGGVPKPYGDKIGVNVRGKNLLPTTMYSDSGTINGVKFTNNGDGSITAVGTATDTTYFTLYGYNTLGDRGTLPSMEPGDALYISDCLLQQTNSQSIISIDENKSTSFYKSTTTMYAAIRISKGKNVNKTFFPMISKGSKPIPYEPYHAPQFASIATPNGLPGIPVSSGGNYTDADGQQWVCDEIDFARGMYVQNIKVDKNLNDLEWMTWGVNKGADGITGFYTYNIDTPKIQETVSNIIRYDENIYGGKRTGIKASIITQASSRAYMIACVCNDTISDVSSNAAAIQSFKKMLAKTDAYMMYVLATPIETPLASDQLAAYKQLHTYADNTTIIDNDAYAYMGVTYRRLRN